ncbi:ANTAR domain-containing protein [Desulfofundulus thermobenzoicus]|uniref:Stage 0 sporulation protein A homolog n=1 Tax=Desulfofundulus thermobenzoicus TaxID=29376 RepID=A0A6N7ISU5_9FIRM|nr:ANTAR domain-containing protein [Desulfofundulus thermobenzoicus]MQL52589.1 ANTAR domain-containing protein [Desulfofundulus thermobenzoicus]HHW43580.1 ANTAR domain-containing protein [Desulfotomaculum sp.]
MFRTRIIIAHSDKDFTRRLKEILRHAGYMVVGDAGDGRVLLQMVFQTTPDLVIMEDQLPGGEGISVPGIIEEHRVAPVVLTTGALHYNPAELVRVPGVYGILPGPLLEEMVVPTIEMALALFERVMRLEKEIGALRRTLEERKLVERAKGLLMEKKGLGEREAYKYLQKLSMDRCLSMARVARELIGRLEKKNRDPLS